MMKYSNIPIATRRALSESRRTLNVRVTHHGTSSQETPARQWLPESPATPSTRFLASIRCISPCIRHTYDASPPALSACALKGCGT